MSPCSKLLPRHSLSLPVHNTFFLFLRYLDSLVYMLAAPNASIARLVQMDAKEMFLSELALPHWPTRNWLIFQGNAEKTGFV